MTVYIGSAWMDENKKSRGGQPGDQTGKEVRTQPWYLSPKGWRVFRAKDESVAEKIAADMKAACDNPAIGYDQGDRLSLYNASETLGFDCAKVQTPCECDCSALVQVCIAYAGILLRNFNTASEPRRLLASGAFDELTGAEYTDSPDRLRRGDVIVTKTKGHTAVILNDGEKAHEPEPTPGVYFFDRALKYGCEGSDVVDLKKLLIDHGYQKGITIDTKASKRFGSATRKMVKTYQKDHGLKVDGIAGHDTVISLGGVWIGK